MHGFRSNAAVAVDAAEERAFLVATDAGCIEVGIEVLSALWCAGTSCRLPPFSCRRPPHACPLAGSNPLKPQPVIPILAVVRFLDPEVQIPTASQLYSPLNQLCQLPPFCISIHRCNNHRPCWHLGCSGSDQLRLLGVKPPPAEDPSSETREQEMGVGPSDREGEATRIAVQEVARWYCYQGPSERMAPCAGSEVAFLSRRGSQF